MADVEAGLSAKALNRGTGSALNMMALETVKPTLSKAFLSAGMPVTFKVSLVHIASLIQADVGNTKRRLELNEPHTDSLVSYA